MDEKFWKRLEELIAKLPNWAIQSAGTETLDDGAHGFVIHLRKLYDESDYVVEDAFKVEPLRCKLGFHKWGMWGDTQPNIYNILGWHQARECALCGMTQHNTGIRGGK